MSKRQKITYKTKYGDVTFFAKLRKEKGVVFTKEELELLKIALRELYGFDEEVAKKDYSGNENKKEMVEIEALLKKLEVLHADATGGSVAKKLYLVEIDMNIESMVYCLRQTGFDMTEITPDFENKIIRKAMTKANEIMNDDMFDEDYEYVVEEALKEVFRQLKLLSEGSSAEESSLEGLHG